MNDIIIGNVNITVLWHGLKIVIEHQCTKKLNLVAPFDL